eukprot:g21347.t1
MGARSFARPWIHAFRPFELEAAWWTPAQRTFSDQLFRARIAAHPVIVLPTIHRLPEMGIPQVCVLGRSNVGKSSLINALVHGKDVWSASYSSFTGQVIVVDLSELDSKSSEDFQGSKWLENKSLPRLASTGRDARSRNRQPVGFDLEWPPDRMKDSNNPIALMQFSDDETALLVRTHRTERWLPNILKQVLSSENCQKICVGWDGADKKKMKSSFELEVAGLLDLATLASQKGLRERGLKALAEHFGLHMKKDGTDQIAYAAEDAYFTYILKDKLEALPDLEEEGVDLAVEGQLALQPGWKEAGKREDALERQQSRALAQLLVKGLLIPKGRCQGERDTEKGEWKCRLCEHVVIKSVQSIESHIKSKQHQKAVSPEAEVNSPSKDPFDRLWNIPDYVDFAQQELVCTLCSSKSASVLGMYQHLAGDKHYRRDIIWIKERNQLEYTETGRPVVRKGFVRGQPRAEAEAKAAQGSKEGKEATGEESRWSLGRAGSLAKRYYYWPVADRTKTQWHYPAANGAKPARTESRLEEKVEKPPEKKVEKKVEEAPKLSKTSERTSKLPEVDDEWEEHETEFGCKFYYNLKTQTSHWQRSLDPAPSKPPLSRRFEMRGERAGRECDGVAEIVLPPGWRQVADEAGKTFYWDAETQKSSWNPPPNYKQKDWQRKVTGEGAYWIWIGTELESSMSFWDTWRSTDRFQDSEVTFPPKSGAVCAPWAMSVPARRRKDDSLPAASADELEAESSQPPEPSELCERSWAKTEGPTVEVWVAQLLRGYAEEQLQFEELSFCYGLRWRSKSSNGVDFHWVTLQLDVQRGDSEQRRLVDFEGHRSSDFRKDEAMHCVDHELVRHLHRWLLPSLASPVLLLDRAGRGVGTHLLQEMLNEECWAAESDSELLENLSIQDGPVGPKDALNRPGYGPAHKVSDELRQGWEDLVKAYLKRSQGLRRAICLVDSSQGLRRQDERLWETVMESGRQMMVVLTKADKCHPVDLHKNVAEVLAALQHLDQELIWPYVHAVSAEHDLGLREFRASVSYITMVVGWIIAGYFGCGFLLHLLLWLCAWLQSLCCPRRWPDVAVQNKRKSEGGEQAIVGAGHECYEYDTPGWPPYALFKVVFAICTGLLPFRLISFVLVFCLTILTARPVDRGICNAGFALLSRLLCNLSAVYTVQVFHKERLDWIGRPGKHPVLVPNHISMLEAFYLEYLTWGMSGCVAKSQFAIPGVRSATQFSNAVAVDTKDKDVKQKVNEGILKFVHNEPDEKGRYPCGRAFVIYPEGITNSQRGLFRFNTGAFATGMAVQPVVQRFPYKYMMLGNRPANSMDLQANGLQSVMSKRFMKNKVLCKYFAEGTCTRGKRCRFAHDVKLASPLLSPLAAGDDHRVDRWMSHTSTASSTAELTGEAGLRMPMMRPVVIAAPPGLSGERVPLEIFSL